MKLRIRMAKAETWWHQQPPHVHRAVKWLVVGILCAIAAAFGLVLLQENV